MKVGSKLDPALEVIDQDVREALAENVQELSSVAMARWKYRSDAAFGPRFPTQIQAIVLNLDLVLLPMVNPGGRSFCLIPGGYPMSRKNRSNHAGHACRGVDLNRNCDFLWSSGIGTSSDRCSDVYKGPAAFSEPETRNVRWLIDQFTNATCMIDIHSYSELGGATNSCSASIRPKRCSWLAATKRR